MSKPNLRKQKAIREYTTKSAAQKRVVQLQEFGFTGVEIKPGFFKRFQVAGKPPKGYN